jgi:hypothetical protein
MVGDELSSMITRPEPDQRRQGNGWSKAFVTRQPQFQQHRVQAFDATSVILRIDTAPRKTTHEPFAVEPVRLAQSMPVAR